MEKKRFEYYCDDIENVENYEAAKADNFKGWDCHHRLETHNSDGERRLVDITLKELKALGMYLHRPAGELIFMRTTEHRVLHMKGKPKSEESIKKSSEARKGKRRSEEQRRKMSEAMKVRKLSEEARKKMSEPCKGKHWKLVDGKRVWY